jgi:L-xylulokinase
MMGSYVIGLDNGGTYIKAALFDQDLQQVAVYGRQVTVQSYEDGRVERDMDDLWQANCDAVRGLLDKTGIDPGEVRSVAIAGHGKGLYLVQDDGSPAAPGVLSADTRSLSYRDAWVAEGIEKRGYPITRQPLWAYHPVCILAWFQDHQSEVLDRTRWIFSCKDYIRFKFTSEAATEETDGASSWLYDVEKRCYSDELLQMSGLSGIRQKLPTHIVRSDEIAGYITADASRACGLAEGTPVAGGVFDINASGLATGLHQEDQMTAIMGTWSCIEYITRTVPAVDDRMYICGPHPVPGFTMIHDGSPTGASNLEWVFEHLLSDFSERVRSEGRSLYQEADDLVSSVYESSSELLYLPYVFTSNTGYNGKGGFIGLESWHTLSHMLQAVYEGVLFSFKLHIDRLLQIHPGVSEIRVIGGPTRSPIWMQMFADLMDCPIVIPKGDELGALGAAICAAMSIDWFDSYEQAFSVSFSCDTTYVPASGTARMAKKFSDYQRLIEALRPFYTRTPQQ